MTKSYKNRPPRGKTSKNTPWHRPCPQCKQTMYYSSKGNLVKAIKNNRVCMQCKNIFTDEYRQKIASSLKGKTYINRKSNKKTTISPFHKSCPACNSIIYYANKYSLDRSIRTNAVCNGCASHLYKKTFNCVITQDHINKMTATKAGYDSYDEYVIDYPKKQQYRREVRRITRAQPIHLLPNYSAYQTSVGRNGIQNAYQLDHIISIDEGYKRNIPPHVIGNIKNLQIISWEHNIAKRNKPSQSFYSWIHDILNDAVFDHMVGQFPVSVYSKQHGAVIHYTDIRIDGEFSSGISSSSLYKVRQAVLDRNEIFINVFSSEWEEKTELVKHKILHILNRSSTIPLYARTMRPAVISNTVAKEFLEEHHIQGFTPSTYYYGLYHGVTLVAVMTFSKNRVVTGNRPAENTYEMVRYATHMNYKIIGGFSKLLQFFIREHRPITIYSYANLRYSQSTTVYDRTGFKPIHTTAPGYFYVKDGTVLHRYRFRKSTLVSQGYDPNLSETDIMKQLGYDRIWDCGHRRYELNCLND